MVIHLVGTSHISPQSKRAVHLAFAEHDPDVVAVELDAQRLATLQQTKNNRISLRLISHIGFGGFLFALFGRMAQKKLGALTGVVPGSEMLWAVRLAQQQQKQVLLIDQPLALTLYRFSHTVPAREKWRMFFDVLFGLLGFGKRLAFDLSSVPSNDVLSLLLEVMRKRYPHTYRVFVDERNKHMAAVLKTCASRTVVAVVGAGHIQGLRRELAQPI